MTTFVFLFMGVEMSAAHAREIKNVKRNYPLALLIVGVVTVALSIPGALLVAMIVPNKDLNLLSGVMQAFVKILGAYGWVVVVIALLHVIGGSGRPPRGRSAPCAAWYRPPGTAISPQRCRS